MSLFWLYLCLLLIIIGIELYKATNTKRQEEVRVHYRVPTYNGPNPFTRRILSYTALSVFAAIIGIFTYAIHNAQPYRLLECVAFSINCPIAITYGTIDDKN
eukprot:287317_1